jgi:hypothetical protein
MLVPGGGVEPPRPCDRRILSPAFAISHQVAIGRIKPHNYSVFNDVKAELCLQCVAPKSIKVGNEQPPKQPPDFISFLPDFIIFLGGLQS